VLLNDFECGRLYAKTTPLEPIATLGRLLFATRQSTMKPFDIDDRWRLPQTGLGNESEHMAAPGPIRATSGDLAIYK